MDAAFSRYVDPAFRYAYRQNPARVRSRDDALRDGLNCVALAHLLIRDLFGCALPGRLQTYELIHEREYFEPVPSPEHMRAGDLVWLGPERPSVPLDEFVPRRTGDDITNMTEFPVKHVAICTDGFDDRDPVLLHASLIEGTNALWPLRRFSDHDRYGRIYAIRRLRSPHRSGRRGPTARLSDIR